MKRKILNISLLLLAFYCAGYGFFRYTGDLIRIQGKGSDQGNHIRAKTGEWDALASDMAKNSNSIWLKAASEIVLIKAPILNAVFWVPRNLESAFWNVTLIEK